MLLEKRFFTCITDSASGSEGEGSPDQHKRSKFEDVSDKESETESVPASGEVGIYFLVFLLMTIKLELSSATLNLHKELFRCTLSYSFGMKPTILYIV